MRELKLIDGRLRVVQKGIHVARGREGLGLAAECLVAARQIHVVVRVGPRQGALVAQVANELFVPAALIEQLDVVGGGQGRVRVLRRHVFGQGQGRVLVGVRFGRQIG